MKYLGPILRIIISLCAAACLVWACFLSPFNAGSVLGFLLFGVIIAVCVLWKPFCRFIGKMWHKLAGRIALIAAAVSAAVGAGVCVFLSVNMAAYFNRPVENVRAVLVLGCKVRGEEPSYMLRQRLDTALEVLEEKPGAVCVVSGGRGDDEDISEAEAMRRYLVENGIASERIFLEDKSVDTRENFLFSKPILEKLGITDSIAVVTHDFHQYRADFYARENGLGVGHYSARSRPSFFLNYWLREWIGLLKAFLT